MNAGALFANNVSTGGTASSTGTGNVTVVSGATLGGGTTTPTTGFYNICGTVNVASGGTLSPGNSPGVLTVNNTVTLASGSTYQWEIATQAP